MKLIAGLGNPGKKYQNTRHNAGFLTLDLLAKEINLQFRKQDKFFSEIAETSNAENEKILLAKPLTYMNDSGKAIRAIKDFYKIENENIHVVHDEIDLRLGTFKLSHNSGSAGHKGVESIIQAIGRDFLRYRIGIDNRASREIAPTDQYVLEPFTLDEEKTINEILLKSDGVIDQLTVQFSLKNKK